MRNRNINLGGENATQYTHMWLRKQPPTVGSISTHGGYVQGWKERESRGKDKELNFGEKILRNKTNAPLFHSMIRVWFYMCSQRNLYNSGLAAGPQEAAYWWKKLKPLLW